jgi:hypothetical protein
MSYLQARLYSMIIKERGGNGYLKLNGTKLGVSAEKPTFGVEKLFYRAKSRLFQLKSYLFSVHGLTRKCHNVAMDEDYFTE